MDKLVVGGTRFLLLCALLLLLPSLAAAQCPPAITVQLVWTQDTGGKDKTTFAPGETIQFAALVSSNYGGSGQTSLAITTSFYGPDHGTGHLGSLRSTPRLAVVD